MNVVITIDGKHHEVPEEVRQRMVQYVQAQDHWYNQYNKLALAAHKVRSLQAQFFKSKTPDLLRASKAAEKELDELLKGTTTTEKTEQKTLF
jgi:hypothetical protein